LLEENKLPGADIVRLSDGHQSTNISYAESMDNYRKNTDWWVVFAAFDLPDFQNSTIWISKKTKLSIETVVEALEGLETLGFLVKKDGKYLPISEKALIKFDLSKKEKAVVLDEHALISRQVLNNLNENAMAAFEHRCFASNANILTELYSDISKAFDKAYQASLKAKDKNQILKMTFTATDVLPGKGQ
jgi:hypothetical protein